MKTEQLALQLKADGAAASLSFQLPPSSGPRAIEDLSFPFEHLSTIAEVESWRKEIYRPIYHVHKWWAQRLGSIFRAIVLGSCASKSADVLDLFYKPVRLDDTVVFDPFMGSGTTIGETLKAGGRAIGFDINPVAYFSVRNALAMPAREDILTTFRAIEEDVAVAMQRYYQAALPDGSPAQALYYFWVKQVRCPDCSTAVDLFSRHIFAQHAYPRRHPRAQALCPKCGAISAVRYDDSRVMCLSCREAFNPQAGPARGAKAICTKCNVSFPIARAIRDRCVPPEHRLYAKLVVTNAGHKMYLRADQNDHELFAEAERELATRVTPYPTEAIEPGYNTNQVLNYCYTHWHQMFNPRQLLCLNILSNRIREISDPNQRELFTCLFSGTLEFNNMFTSFKGEGTGAVRHMFYHHILKPERTPLEANVWGSPKSSGSFSTLFRSRLLRAVDYAENPFELRLKRLDGRLKASKVFNLSLPLTHKPVQTFAQFSDGAHVYIGCRNSADTDIKAGSVDAIVTDPPFFDNVHYSQLADFFYVWQRHLLGQDGIRESDTTRAQMEVQNSDVDIFTDRLSEVWRECHRVLKESGLLVFTYHHSRTEGWRCVLESVTRAGFTIVAAHPVKAEMSVATPKHQASEPIDLDVIIVCRKRTARSPRAKHPPISLVTTAFEDARSQALRLRGVGRSLSRNDVRVVLMGQLLTQLSRECSDEDVVPQFVEIQALLDEMIDKLFAYLYASRSDGGLTLARGERVNRTPSAPLPPCHPPGTRIRRRE